MDIPGTNCSCSVLQYTKVRSLFLSWVYRSVVAHHVAPSLSLADTDVVDSAQAIVLAMRKFDMDPVEPVNRVNISLHSSPGTFPCLRLCLCVSRPYLKYVLIRNHRDTPIRSWTTDWKWMLHRVCRQKWSRRSSLSGTTQSSLPYSTARLSSTSWTRLASQSTGCSYFSFSHF
jgi:hypothetical protein